jgi:hypothetical protein
MLEAFRVTLSVFPEACTMPIERCLAEQLAHKVT